MNENVSLDNNLQAQGKIKIELFDEGHKVQEVEDTNFIAKGVNNLYLIMMRDLYRRYKSGGPTTRVQLGDPFGKMVLSDADHDESPNSEWVIRGNLTGYGYANKVSVGTDGLEGTYNVDESYVSETQVRIVMDFPTNAANGDINSVYFTESNDRYSVYGLYLQDILNRPLGSVHSVQLYNDKYYTIAGNGNSGDYTINVHDLTFNLIDTVTLNQRVRDIAIFDGDIYMCYNPYTREGIYKIPINDLTSPPEKVSPVVSDRYYGVTYDPSKEQFICISPGQLDIYDEQFTLLSRVPTEMTGNSITGTGSGRINYNEGLLITGYNNIYRDGSHIEHGGGITIVGITDKYLFDPTGYIYPKTGFSSRAKLSSTVTKTSSNTMKVTYDFILPSIYD